MKIGILHLSDMHLKNGLTDFTLSKVCNALSVEFVGIDVLYFVVSGDLVFSGKKEEYDLLDSAIKNFSDKVHELKCDLEIKYIFSPGNHDCDFERGNQSRNNNIDQLINNGDEAFGSDESVIETCTVVQDNFFDFLSSYNNDVEYKGKKRINYGFEYDHDNFLIRFNCFNTSWLSKKREKYGELYMPLLNHESSEIVSVKPIINIAVYHHPDNWFSGKKMPLNHRQFYDYIVRKNAIALVGHEHTADARKEEGISNHLSCHFFDAGYFYDGNLYNEFEYLTIDNDMVLKSELYKYNGTMFDCVDNANCDLSDSIKNDDDLIAKHDFLKFMNDVGAAEIGGTERKIHLENIYVYPKLRDIFSVDDAFVKSEDIIHNLQGNALILLYGADQSGKTALLKKYFIDLYCVGLRPLYLTGEKDIFNDNIKQVLKKAIKNQYESKHDILNRYMSIEKKERVLLIDNFHLIKSPINHKKIIEELKGLFGSIIVTAANISQFTDILEMFEDVLDVKRYDIVRFGHTEREELINKWLVCYKPDCDNLFEKRVHLHDRLNDIIGKNIVPSYPIFLITIIHSLENEHTFDNEITSYGHCYYALIYLLLRHNNVTEKEVDSYFNILTHLSYYLFENDYPSIGQEKINQFFADYKKDYVLTSDIKEATKNLINAKILCIDSVGNIGFKYHYIYYYFVAKYISDYKSTNMELISEICTDMNKKRNLFILLFLTHHSKNEAIIDEILLNTMCIYDKKTPIEFVGKEFEFVDKVIDDVTHIVLEDIDPETYRKRVLTERDNKDRATQNDTEDFDEINIKSKTLSPEDSEAEHEKDINLFYRAAKTININGMILKNRYGSIRKTKLADIIEESYLLAFRMMCYIMDVLSEDNLTSTIVDSVKESLEAQGYSEETTMPEKTEIEKLVKKLLSRIMYMMHYHIFEATSYSVGTEKLISIFDDVAKKNDKHPFVLLSFMIKIRTTNKLDISELLDLKNRFKGNYFLLNLLKRTVIEYLYMHDLDYNDKNKIANIINIPVKKQLVMKGRYTS